MEMTTRKPTATACCNYCDWTAHHADDDVGELARFLRALMIAHVKEAHPEKFARAIDAPDGEA